MDDFLHNLRTGKDKRYERTRRNYDSPQYRSLDRQNGIDRRKKGVYKQQSSEQVYLTIAKVLPAVKTLLESIVEDRQQLNLLAKRQTVALEAIAKSLKKMSGQEDAAMDTPIDMEEDDVQESLLLKEEGDDVSELSVSEDALDVIQRLREEGLSFEKIAQQLETDGIPTPSGRGRWRGQTVSKLLKE